jgi:hypothetical protein
LAGTPVGLRIGAAAIGFAAYMLLGRRVLVGIIAAELALLAGLYML